MSGRRGARARPRSRRPRSAQPASTQPRRRRPPPKRRTERRRRRIPFLIGSVFLIGTLVLSVATLQALISQNSFRIRELSRQGAALQEGVGQLSLEVARLSSPARIAKKARQQGLRLPDEVHPLPVAGNTGTDRAAPGPGLAMKPGARESP